MAFRYFMTRPTSWPTLLSLVAACTWACSSSPSSTAASVSGADASVEASKPDDSGASGLDAPTDGTSVAIDGTPERRACTSTFGHALTQTFGRLDGVLVAIVSRNHGGCNGDSSHIHLQVESRAATYDVAVNIDGLSGKVTHPLVSGTWSDGWHPDASLDYVGDLGVHAASFATTSETALEQQLAKANHVSVFATGYGTGGVHLVHRNGSGHDGAVVIDPLSESPQFLVFRFPQQVF